MANKSHSINSSAEPQGVPESPEVALWRAVIAQAVDDACGTARAREEKLTREARNIRQTARDWLLGGSKDFGLVCQFALLDPDAVRESAAALAAKGWRRGRPTRIADSIADDAA